MTQTLRTRQRTALSGRDIEDLALTLTLVVAVAYALAAWL